MNELPRAVNAVSYISLPVLTGPFILSGLLYMAESNKASVCCGEMGVESVQLQGSVGIQRVA